MAENGDIQRRTKDRIGDRGAGYREKMQELRGRGRQKKQRSRGEGEKAADALGGATRGGER